MDTDNQLKVINQGLDKLLVDLPYVRLEARLMEEHSLQVAQLRTEHSAEEFTEKAETAALRAEHSARELRRLEATHLLQEKQEEERRALRTGALMEFLQAVCSAWTPK
jgi:hypothetical protein